MTFNYSKKEKRKKGGWVKTDAPEPDISSLLFHASYFLVNTCGIRYSEKKIKRRQFGHRFRGVMLVAAYVALSRDVE